MDDRYLKNKRILLVDDEKAILDMVADFLREDGYTQVRTAGTAAEAVAAAEEWHPDFAVLDVMLPDGDGFSLFERLRRFTEMPMLFLTARGEDEDRIRGLGLGADDYMVKPFLPKEFLLRVGIILRRSFKGEDPLVRLAGSRVDFSRAEVVRDGERLPLTAPDGSYPPDSGKD